MENVCEGCAVHLPNLDKSLHEGAQRGGHGKCLQTLIQAGADVNSYSISGETALFLAIRKSRCECVKFLLEAGADVNKRDQKEVFTPLMLATMVRCNLVSKKTSSMSRVLSLALSLAPIRFSPCMCKCHTIPTWQPFFLGRNFTLFCQNGGRTAQRTFETRTEMELSVYRLHLHINICQESHNCLN